MKTRSLRVAVGGLAVVVAGAGVVFALGRGADEPARLPVLAGAGTGGVGEDSLSGGAARPASAGIAAMPIWGNVVYQAGSGLPGLGGEGRAYRLAATTDTDTVTALATALGLSGGVSQDEQGWHVVDGDRRLDVYRGPGVSWSYYTGVIADGGVVSSGSGSASTGSATVVPEGTVCDPCKPDDPTGSVPPVEPQRPADLPAAGDAERIALDLLRAAGAPVDGARTNTFDQFSSWGVQVDPLIDGTATWGFSSYVSVGGGGKVESASGFLAVPQPADSYPLIGTAAAIDRLNDGTALPGPRPMMGIAEETSGSAAGDGAVRILPAPNPATEPATDPAGEPVPPAPPKPPEPGSSGGGSSGSGGATEPGCAPDQPDCTVVTIEPQPAPDCAADGCPAPEPIVVTLDAAEHVLLFLSALDGSEGWLVPGYLFSAADGTQAASLAVADEFLGEPPATDGEGHDGVPVTGGGSGPGVPATTAVPVEPKGAPAPAP